MQVAEATAFVWGKARMACVSFSGGTNKTRGPFSKCGGGCLERGGGKPHSVTSNEEGTFGGKAPALLWQPGAADSFDQNWLGTSS